MEILHHGAVNGVTGSCHELRRWGHPLEISGQAGKADSLDLFLLK